MRKRIIGNVKLGTSNQPDVKAKKNAKPQRNYERENHDHIQEVFKRCAMGDRFAR